jgi:hypothetical protein
MIRKYSILLFLAATSLVIFQNCRKDDQAPKKYLVEFPSTINSYWKVKYLNSTGTSGNLKDVCDSIFFSSETVDLNVITEVSKDTLTRTFNILKVFRKVTYYDSTGWYNFPVSNYGIYRLDSVSNKLLGVHTSDMRHESTPRSEARYFMEFTLFDYDLKSGSDAKIRATTGIYECVGFVAKTTFSGHSIIKQCFTPISSSKIIAYKMQFGCVLNSSDYTGSALPNSLRQTNYPITGFVYYWDLEDSLAIENDTRIFP